MTTIINPPDDPTRASPPSGDGLHEGGRPVLSSRPPCVCHIEHEPRLVVVTGGPGAGKTAVLELVRRQFCEHVVVLPEAAGILFGGGFPRTNARSARRAAQRAIFHVQRELERLTLSTSHAAVILCDRGTLDGLAYWPGEPETFFQDLSTTAEEEFACYSAVIHLRTPSLQDGYDHTNPLRVETARQAHAIDARITGAWKAHSRYTVIPSESDFFTKASLALAAIAAEVPGCCAAAGGSRLRQTGHAAVPGSVAHCTPPDESWPARGFSSVVDET
ncbi:MAG TPA: ATP-binding protein [Polyangiaceae bacterium]